MCFPRWALSLRVLLLPCLAVALLAITSPVIGQDRPPASPIMVPNPGADLWRAVRQREAPAIGGTQVRGVETGVLIERSGEDFRNYRRQDFIGTAGLFIGAAAAAIAVFYLVRGSIRIPDGRSGRKVKRFSDIDLSATDLVTHHYSFRWDGPVGPERIWR